MSKIDDFEDRVEKRLEAIWNKLDGLPCAGRGERLASVEELRDRIAAALDDGGRP